MKILVIAIAFISLPAVTSTLPAPANEISGRSIEGRGRGHHSKDSKAAADTGAFTSDVAKRGRGDGGHYTEGFMAAVAEADTDAIAASIAKRGPGAGRHRAELEGT